MPYPLPLQSWSFMLRSSQRTRITIAESLEWIRHTRWQSSVLWRENAARQ